MAKDVVNFEVDVEAQVESRWGGIFGGTEMRLGYFRK
jgi:hypothetical protein